MRRTSNALIAALTVAVLAIGSQAGAAPQRGHEKSKPQQTEQRRPRGEQASRPAPVQVQPQRQSAPTQPQARPAPEIRPAPNVRPAPSVRSQPDVRPAPNVRPQLDTRGAYPQARAVQREVQRDVPRFDDRSDARRDDRPAQRYDDRGWNRPPVYIVPSHTVRVYRPYYSFRPRFSLSFGLFVGYPVAYPTWYDPFGYDGYYFGARYSNYRNAYGGVAFDIQPLDAAIYVDGEYVGRAEDFGPLYAPLTLLTGLHRIDLEAQGCRPFSFDLTVVPHQVIPYRGTLRCY